MLLRLRSRLDLVGSGRCLNIVQNAVCNLTLSPRSQALHKQYPLTSRTKAIHSTARWSAESFRRRHKDTIPTADTIYALSTAPGRAAIAVIRVSGPACLDVYGAICPEKPFPHPRVATLRRLKDPQDRTRILDTGALVLYFPAPRTVTGDDVLEFHVHGGPAIVRSVLEAIPSCIDSRPRRRTADYSTIRAAEAGEFTKRAFYNGRLDLTQAEALGETLAAETEQQRRFAIAGADSGLASRYEAWRTTLLYARGELEALIDFSEDQHFDESPADFLSSVSDQVRKLNNQIKLHIHNASRGELLRNGISVALLGAPNAGKSSLLNQIVGREAAIVSAEAGTTRDIVDVQVDIKGWLVKLGDMAGLRGSGGTDYDGRDLHPATAPDAIGQVEREGIKRARQRALQSDLVIVIVSLFRPDNGAIELSVNPELVNAVEQCRVAGKALVFVVNKIDLVVPMAESIDTTTSGLRQRVRECFPTTAHEHNVFMISCKDAALSSLLPRASDPGGVQTFLSGLSHTFTSMTSAAIESDPSIPTIAQPLTPLEAQSYWTASLSVTHRQSTYLQRCCSHLENFLAQCTTERTSTPPRAGASSMMMSTTTIQGSSSHHVDGHDDLVGEIKPAIDENGADLATTTATTAQTLDADEVHDFDIVTAAEHLRYAAECLAKITGRGGGGDVEDVLGVVFEK